MAPPRGAAALWHIKHLAKTGTENGPTESLSFSKALSSSPLPLYLRGRK